MARPARLVGNLPAEATSFVGRRREIAQVRSKLAESRLVSLVGPGGFGKTRLANRAAADLGRGFRDGSWLVELAEVREPALVSGAVLTGLDLRDQAAGDPLTLLLSYLRDKELLLVVDNCEHLLEASAAVVTDIMRAAPCLRVIATSREPLSVPGEYVVPIPPLELPAPHAGEPLSEVLRSEAVTLFTERAAAASGAFELTASNQGAVVDLCRRLDGLPLAIELAAVRTRVLAVEQILGRLTDRFGLLTSGARAALPRHQTLRTTIEWSHDLLSDGERAVLRRSCTFAGRYTLEDVEAVCSSEDVPSAQALDVLASLVDKSLVLKEETQGVACYRMHETMREFASLKLREAGEEKAVELRCAEYYRSRCQRSALEGRVLLLDWLSWADLEIDNIRAVLQRSVTTADRARGAEIAISLGWYWATRATTEGTRWLDEFLGADGADQQLCAWGYFIRGFLATLKADGQAARPALQRAVTMARLQRQRELLCEALSMSSVAESIVGDRAAAKRFLAEADAVAAGIDYLHGTISVLQARAFSGLFEGDLEAVRAAATQGVHLADGSGDLYALEMMLLNLGSAAMLSGERDEARPLFARALRIAGQIDDRTGQYYLLGAFGCDAAFSGRVSVAAQLMGSSDAVRAGMGAEIMPFLRPVLAQAEEVTRAALGTARFEAEFAAGARYSREAAAALALGQPSRAAPKPAKTGAAGPLGRREADVARLIAEGLTNKEIGGRLFISERTVDSHVRSILNKLGFSSRAQIAAWMASDG